MRRSRWDQKPENDEPIASSSRWNGSCNSIEWEHHNITTDSIPGETEHLNNPHPLDYSSENRQRVQSNATTEKEKTDSPLTKSTSGQTTLYPPPWSYVPSLPHMYPGSNQNAQIGYHPPTPWNQLSQGYYSNNDYQNEHPFDVEWWDQQRQSLEAHLRIGSTGPNKEQHPKFEPSRSLQWSFGARILKNNERNFDLSRKYCRFPNGNYDRSKFVKDNRNFPQTSLLGNYNKSRFNKFDTYKTDRRLLSMYSPRDTHQNQYRMFKYNPENGGKPQDFSNSSRSSSSYAELGVNVKKAKVKTVGKTTNQQKGKKIKKKNSAAELARKKALAAAASKLRQTFLAAKKKNKKASKKGKILKRVHSSPTETATDSNSSKVINVQDLSVPKSIPKTGTSLEHDIDIKFSASEWESVGRGEGGTHSVLEISSTGSKSSKRESEDCVSDSDSVQTIEEIESGQGTSDNDSENSLLSSDEEEEQPIWSNEKVNLKPVRRRHVSETIRIESEPSNGHLKLRRVRSFSTSQVENSPVKSPKTRAVSSDLKKMLVKQLLSMDKKSLQELVDDPKSRKAQFMVNHFMNIHRNALSQKLNHLRFKSVSSSVADDDDDDDINILQAITTADLENLPSDVLNQVKEILEFEANGSAQEMWEEVSLSFSDLFSECRENENSRKSALGRTEEEQSSHEQKENSTQDNGSDDLDCQIVTPPPKQPATTITIPDSDNEIPSDNSNEIINSNVLGSPIKIDSLEKDAQSVTPPNSPSPSEPEGSLIKPQELPHSIPSPLEHPDRPQNPLPRSPSVPLLLSPPIKQSQSSNPTPPQPSPPLISPDPSVEPKTIKLSIKNKITDDSEASSSQTCELNRPPTRIKVKQERPSPMIECGLCMHPPRSPHTPQCGFSYNIPPPVPMIPGSPQPLGAVPPQRPVPHLASSGIPAIFKQERPSGSYLNLEHINRPSSEERPKNPAPPDTANSEPPSPLPIPPPQSTLHPPPRPLIFSSEDRFVEPPRPPSPPPPQHSPRIKLERQTPQYICCCMRNECERSNSSRQSADFRRGSTTPQGQLCESAMLRATPHSVYKFEPPFISNLRSRTPHNGLVNMFPTLSPNARCLASSNGSLSQGLVPNQCLTIDPDDSAHNSKVNVGVQTDKASRNFAPNVACARSVTPLSSKTDQTTSTEDLNHNNRDSSLEDTCDDYKQLHDSNKKDSSACFVPTSSVQDDGISSFALVNKFKEMKLSGTATNQLLQLSKYEEEVLKYMDSIEKKERELAKEKKRLKNIVRKIHDMRLQNLIMQQSNTPSTNMSMKTEGNLRTQENMSTDDDNVVSNSKGDGPSLQDQNGVSTNSNENQYMVSSSQEFPVEFKTLASPSEYFDNSPSHSVQGERCTSSSLPRESLYQKESSDSEEENIKNEFCLKTKSHNYRLGKSCFINRNRLNSGSTSEEYQEEKDKENTKNRPNSSLSSHRNNSTEDPCSNVVIPSEDKINKDEEDKETVDLSFSHQENSLIKEHDHICSLTTNRKGSLTGSPQSPKMRNSSGSEHGYSLRSRGPPSDLLDFNSDSQLSKDTLISSQEEHLDISGEKALDHDKNDDEQADDEFEKEEEGLEARNNTLKLSSNENYKKRKRKRKTRYHIAKCKKKKDMVSIYSNTCKQVSSCSSNNTSEKIKEEFQGEDEKQKKNVEFLYMKEEFKFPPSHLAAVLDIKVVGDIIFTTSTDGTARLFDPVSGVVLCSYQNHTDSVTSIQVIGKPQFSVDAPPFMVVTGSEDCSIHVYDGKTGVLTQKRNCAEPVRCLEYRWGYLFIGTDGGCGIKWNLKDKKLGEKIQFCGKGITRMLTHLEGGRKVLVVGAKTTPIMIRDAMSGLFLRTLEYVQLTMYAAVFEGSLLYTGGTDKKIFVYDYCEGNVKKHLEAEASISGLMLVRNKYLVATCYDGVVRIFRLPEGNLIHSLQVESSNKMFICSALFKNKILLGNKDGDIVCCDLPNLEN